MTVTQSLTRHTKLLGLEKFDQILGLRSWGLILYGGLPASLSLLGFVKVENIRLGAASSKWLPILLISLLPLLITFLLVRAREKEWYFTEEYLNLRSSITTLLVLLCATAISGVAGMIRGEYVFSLSRITDQAHMNALAESYLFGIASLVVSSTFFAIIITRNSDLPGLPSVAFVGSIGKIREQLIAIQRDPIWEGNEPANDANAFGDLKARADNLAKDLQTAMLRPGDKLAKRGLAPLRSDVILFAQSVIAVKEGQSESLILIRWKIRFADLDNSQDRTLEHLRNSRQGIIDEYRALQRLKSLRLGG
jgi:hypothetical protein